MLSHTLSRCFLFAFFVVIIGATGNIIGQITLKPFQIKTGEGSFLTFGKPGLKVTATRSTNDEAQAPDTSIKYTIKNKNDKDIANGPFSILNNDEKRKIIQKAYTDSGRIFLDTNINLILLLRELHSNISSSETHVEDLKDGRAVCVESTVNSKTKKLTVYRDTFANQQKAYRYLNLKNYNLSNQIFEENNLTETLYILPANQWQHLFLIIYQTAIFIFWSLLFLSLRNLFRNFSFQNFFTYSNIALLKKIGWFLLLPQFLYLILYLTYLTWISPEKTLMSYPSNNFSRISSYRIESGINWELVFFGLGTVVLSYIFKNGLKIKEEQDLTV